MGHVGVGDLGVGHLGVSRAVWGRAAGLIGTVALAGPALTTVAPLRRRLLPGLSGVGPGPHVALTFDDGPDPESTPAFLDLLERHDVRATFFLLGRFAAEQPGLVRAMAEAGHELAVHGWDHRCVVLKGPRTLVEDLRRTAGTVEGLTGRGVGWYRPPYGVLTTPALLAARRAGLRTVLWTAWGRDWEAGADPARIAATVGRTLRPGGTVLLHDTDRTSAPGSWTRTLIATDALLRDWSARGLPVGPLAAHGLGR